MVKKSIHYITFFLFLFSVLPIYSGKKHRVKNKTLTFSGKDYTLKLRARKWKRGELVLVKIRRKPNARQFSLKQSKLFWRKKNIPLNSLGETYIGFIALDPNMSRGVHKLRFLSLHKDNRYKDTFSVPIENNYKKTSKKKKSKITRLKFKKKYKPKKRYSKKTMAFITKCLKHRKRALQSKAKFRINQKGFYFPLRKIYITSRYNAWRRYSKRKAKPHKGVDFRGKIGTRIYSIAAGKVVLSRRMFFEGIFTIINHGANIYSFYMHQSKTRVRPGQIVSKGQYIGKVGATGRVTGPHLHLGLLVDGVFVNPLSAIHLKVN